MAQKLVFIFAFVTIALIFISKSEAIIRVYEDVNFAGQARTLPPFKACLDLAKLWDDRISSVNTEGGCIFLCEHQRCLGKCEKFYPGSQSHNDLRVLELNDKVSSYRNCEGANDNNIYP